MDEDTGSKVREFRKLSTPERIARYAFGGHGILKLQSQHETFLKEIKHLEQNREPEIPVFYVTSSKYISFLFNPFSTKWNKILDYGSIKTSIEKILYLFGYFHLS